MRKVFDAVVNIHTELVLLTLREREVVVKAAMLLATIEPKPQDKYAQPVKLQTSEPGDWPNNDEPFEDD